MNTYLYQAQKSRKSLILDHLTCGHGPKTRPIRSPIREKMYGKLMFRKKVFLVRSQMWQIQSIPSFSCPSITVTKKMSTKEEYCALLVVRLLSICPSVSLIFGNIDRPTRPRPYRWSLFSQIMSVRLSIRHKRPKTSYNAKTKHAIDVKWGLVGHSEALFFWNMYCFLAMVNCTISIVEVVLKFPMFVFQRARAKSFMTKQSGNESETRKIPK